MNETKPSVDVPPRICHVIGTLGIGGAERQVVNLLNELPAEQAKVIVLRSDAGPLKYQLKPEIEVKTQRMSGLMLPVDLYRLMRNIRDLQVDVVQTHMFWANLYGTLAARMAGVPAIVTTEHGKNMHKPPWARRAERILISRLADMRICVSEDIRQLRMSQDGVPPRKLCVIPNGTPVRKQNKLVDRVPVTVGTLGRLIEAKDFPTLIGAVALARDQGVNCQLVIVGGGPEHERLAAEVKARQLHDVVVLAGLSDDVDYWLQQFDIFAISSIREGQPLSLLEAMATGLPIIATRAGGIPDTVEDGKEAILVPPRDVPAMAAAIALLVSNLRLRQDIGTAARNRMLKCFSVKSSLRAHLDLYQAVLRDK